jgi:hypothetical protein
MKVRKFNVADTNLVRSPGQGGDIFVGNLVDEKDGGAITIGYGRYGPGQSLTETMAVDDVMIVLEGRLAVSTSAGTVFFHGLSDGRLSRTVAVWLQSGVAMLAPHSKRSCGAGWPVRWRRWRRGG